MLYVSSLLSTKLRLETASAKPLMSRIAKWHHLITMSMAFAVPVYDCQ